MIYTHQNVDLDAVASLWFWIRFVDKNEKFSFVPANWDGETMNDDDVALDIDAGGNGIKGKNENGEICSCFKYLINKYANEQDQKALKKLSLFVDAQDRKGNAVRELGATNEVAETLNFTSINAILRAFQSMNPYNDKKVAAKMFEIFDGMLKNGRARIAAEEEAESAEWYGDVAIITNAKKMATNGVLMEKKGAKAVVFIDGNNLGVVRRDDVEVRMDHEAIRAVVEHEEGWFFHRLGFLAARGTRKSPETTPSKIDPYKLAEAVASLL